MTDRKKVEDGVRALSVKTKKKKKAARGDCETCTNPTHGEGTCPAKDLECFGCGKKGHFNGSKACRKKKASGEDVDKKKVEKKKSSKSRKVKESESDDLDTEESSYRVIDVSPERSIVRSVNSNPEEEVSISVMALDHGVESKKAKVKLVVDTVVSKTLVSEEAWLKLKPHKGIRPPLLKKNKRRFVPFGTDGKLECIGRSNAVLEAKAGAKLRTMIYIIRGVSENLLGKTDAVKLGIVEFRPKGAIEKVRMLS